MPDALPLPPLPRPRERILAAARELFHRNGIRGVGVDAIAEAAGTNKMTLYRHFDSKDDLIVAYLAQHRCRGRERCGWTLRAKIPATCRRSCVLGWRKPPNTSSPMAAVAIWPMRRSELTEDGHPARRLIEQLKNDHRHRLADLCRAAGTNEPEILADTLTLLFEGARVSHQAAGSKGPSAEFIRTAEAVIASFTAKRGQKPKPAARAR